MNKNGMAVMGSYNRPSQPTGKTQRFPIVSSNNYTTSVKTPKDAETRALELLRKSGYDAIQSPDWLARKDGKWICFEVKEKSELYSPGKDFPHFGIGIDLEQVWLRSQLLLDLKLRTYLIVYVKATEKVYGNFLDILEQDFHYDTPNGIRIYPVENYDVIQDAPNQNLGGSK